jgi:hypothetical protein
LGLNFPSWLIDLNYVKQNLNLRLKLPKFLLCRYQTLPIIGDAPMYARCRALLLSSIEVSSGMAPSVRQKSAGAQGCQMFLGPSIPKIFQMTTNYTERS